MSSHFLPSDALLLTRLRNYSLPLPILAGDLIAWSNWAKEHSLDRQEEILTLMQIDARLTVPILSKNEISSVLILGPREDKAEYRHAECQAIGSAAAQLALLLENGRLTDRIVEQERLRRELAVASEVQKRLLPDHFPSARSLELNGVCLPARGIGGDYYDFLDLGNKQIGIALADVAGKGIAAALIMSVVQASLRSLAGNNGASLASLAAKMNRLLYRSTGVSSYATFFYAQFDEDSHQLRYVNAGLNPPYLLRNENVQGFVPSAAAIEELSVGGMIIGMFPQLSYEEGVLQLDRNDVLIAFSDGVTEAHNPAEEEFGEERLKGLLRQTANLSIDEMKETILKELKKWMSDAPQHDDLTFLLMKVA